MKKCILTSNYGLKNAKPSPHCFLKICNLENVRPKDVVYVGDDPNKDFVGIKPLGFQTIRVLKGRHKNLKKSKKYQPGMEIKSLMKLNPKLLRRFQNL
jgi:putative hydrolase of the HAD superfamily